jgi:hypothetical protein
MVDGGAGRDGSIDGGPSSSGGAGNGGAPTSSGGFGGSGGTADASSGGGASGASAGSGGAATGGAATGGGGSGGSSPGTDGGGALDSGGLQCSPSRTLCGNQCIDLRTGGPDDPWTPPLNCGSCGNACLAGQVCMEGACPTGGCGSDLRYRLFGSRCFNAFNNPSYCGVPNARVCPEDEVCNGQGACAAGCALNLAACDRSCVNLRTDPHHCGACFNTCSAAERCVDGACITGCAPNQTDCSGKCVDLRTGGWLPWDPPDDCGTCGHKCVAGEVCQEGQCIGGGCTAPSYLQFDSRCFYPINNPVYCGAPGNTRVCEEDWVCNGQAKCDANCVAGLTSCNRSCVNLQTDPHHCGQCYKTCASGICTNGVCFGETDGATGAGGATGTGGATSTGGSGGAAPDSRWTDPGFGIGCGYTTSSNCGGTLTLSCTAAPTNPECTAISGGYCCPGACVRNWVDDDAFCPGAPIMIACNPSSGTPAGCSPIGTDLSIKCCDP